MMIKIVIKIIIKVESTPYYIFNTIMLTYNYLIINELQNINIAN